MQQQLLPYQFESHILRVEMDADGTPWFTAMDVAAILDYSDAYEMTKRLDDDEKQNRQIAGFGPRGVTVINESGLYSAILGSQKPEARRFKHWITAEVLPSIRRTGQYRAKPKAQGFSPALNRETVRLLRELKREADPAVRRVLHAQLRLCCQLAGIDPPALADLGREAPAAPSLADRLYAWIAARCQQKGVPALPKSDLIRRGPYPLRKKATLDPALAELEAAGRVHLAKDGQKTLARPIAPDPHNATRH